MALQMPLDEDLSHLGQVLHSKRIPHRISEHDSHLVVWVMREQDVVAVQALWRQLPTQPLAEEPPSREAFDWWELLRLFPLTLFLIAGSILGALVVEFDPSLNWVGKLTYFDFRVSGGELSVGTATQDDFWRTLTPIFLHFGILHIAFNCLWMWELGQRVEFSQGSLRLLGLTILIGMSSNMAQAFATGPVIFGGMSGVIYGLLGYCLVWSWCRPKESFDINAGIAVFMLVWLVLCLFGISRLLSGADTANAAHLVGLISGAILGLVAAVIDARPENGTVAPGEAENE